MIIVDNRTGKQLQAYVVKYINQVCPLQNGTHDHGSVCVAVSSLRLEHANVRGDYSDWTATIKNLNIVPGKDFFLGVENIRLFDVEEHIVTDTDRAKVIVYDIHDKNLVQTIIQKQRSKQVVVLKFISPRLIDQLVSMRKYYRKLLQLCQMSIKILELCVEGVTVTDAEDKSSDSKQGQQTAAETSNQTSG